MSTSDAEDEESRTTISKMNKKSAMSPFGMDNNSENASSLDNKSARLNVYHNQDTDDSSSSDEYEDAEDNITLNLDGQMSRDPDVMMLDTNVAIQDKGQVEKMPEEVQVDDDAASDFSSDRPEKRRKTNGAIPVTIGLRLGGLKLNSNKVRAARTPVSVESMVDVVDYTHDPQTEAFHPISPVSSKPISPSVESHATNAALFQISTTPSREAAMAVAPSSSLSSSDENDNDNVEEDDLNDVGDQDDAYVDQERDDGDGEEEEEEEGEYFNASEDDESSGTSSVDPQTWSKQRKYYARDLSPDFMGDGEQVPFGIVFTNLEVKKKLLVPKGIIIDDRRKMCDVCQGKHNTEECESSHCSLCDRLDEHFEINCPSIMPNKLTNAPLRRPGNCTTCTCLSDVPKLHQCAHIWRACPDTHLNVQAGRTIPIACYQCGMDTHFGDDCPTTNKFAMKSDAEGSIWNAAAAAQWSSIPQTKFTPYAKYGAAPTKIGSKHHPIAVDDEEDESSGSWFENRLKAAKEKVPDSSFKTSGRSLAATRGRRGKPAPHQRFNPNNTRQDTAPIRPHYSEIRQRYGNREREYDNHDRSNHAPRSGADDYSQDRGFSIRGASVKRQSPPRWSRPRSRSPPSAQSQYFYGYPPERSERSERSNYNGRDYDDRSYHPPRPVSFSMSGRNDHGRPPPRNDPPPRLEYGYGYPGEGQHRRWDGRPPPPPSEPPPLPPGPPPGSPPGLPPRSMRNAYRPGNGAAKQAWKKYIR